MKFLIKYTDLDGDRVTYLNKTYNTRDLANVDLNLIKERKKNQIKAGTPMIDDNHELNKICMVGKNFQIKEIK